MKFFFTFLVATSLMIGACAGCSPPPKPKPSAAHPRPDGEKALRNSLANTHTQPRRK
jgi:hypothetical protein